MILFLPLQIFDIGPDHLLICVIKKKIKNVPILFLELFLAAYAT